MIKSSKDYKAQRARADSWIKAEDDAALKNPVMTYSAQMPAYAYTSLCPDPKLKSSKRRENQEKR